MTSFGLLGGSLGLGLGLAGGLLRGSARSAGLAGLVGIVLGGAAGAGAAKGLVPRYFSTNAEANPSVPLLVHGGLWMSISIAAGLGFGLGIGGRGRVIEAVIYAIAGALLAILTYEFASVWLFPAAQTERPLSRSPGSRLFADLLVSCMIGAALGVRRVSKTVRERYDHSDDLLTTVRFRSVPTTHERSSLLTANADVMVGQFRVQRLQLDAGHVTPKTSAGPVHGTRAIGWTAAGLCGRCCFFLFGRLAGRGVAFEALGFVVAGARGGGGLVRIVAGHAAESTTTFGITAASRPADSLRADPARVFRIFGEVPLEDMAVVALLARHGLRESAPAGVDDCRVRQAELEGGDVVAARTMAALASNGAVGHLGAVCTLAGARVGHVAIDAFRQAVPHFDRFSLKIRRLACVAWIGSRVERSQPLPSAV